MRNGEKPFLSYISKFHDFLCIVSWSQMSSFVFGGFVVQSNVYVSYIFAGKVGFLPQYIKNSICFRHVVVRSHLTLETIGLFTLIGLLLVSTSYM